MSRRAVKIKAVVEANGHTQVVELKGRALLLCIMGDDGKPTLMGACEPTEALVAISGLIHAYRQEYGDELLDYAIEASRNCNIERTASMLDDGTTETTGDWAEGDDG